MFPACADNQCLTLDQALAKVASDTELQLAPGLHELQNFSLLQDVQNVSLKGTSEAALVRVTCNDGVGLGAVNVTNLRLSNLTLDGCGLIGTNIDDVITSLEKSVDLFYQVPLEVEVAFFLGSCRDVTMENVIINGTAGIGLLAVNVVGNSSFVQINFAENNWDINGGNCNPIFGDNSKLGGGAVFLYQDYKPGYATEYTSSSNQLLLDQCTFTRNRACSYQALAHAILFTVP